MKLKYTFFEDQARYDKAFNGSGQVSWKVCHADKASVADFAEFMENIIIDDTSPEHAEEIHIMVIDRDGTASDDFRDAAPHKGSGQLDIETVLKYFAENRPGQMKELANLAWHEYECLFAKLVGYFHIYERYSIEVRGELSDDEAMEAALNSSDGAREVIFSWEPLEVTLRKDVWQGKTGTTTAADYFYEL